jgi:hypothetical protein
MLRIHGLWLSRASSWISAALPTRYAFGAAVSIGLFFAMTGTARGQDVETDTDSGLKLVPKVGVTLRTFPSRAGAGYAATTFAFHPISIRSTYIGKDWVAGQVNPPLVIHDSSLDELHGTYGIATHALTLFNGGGFLSVDDDVSATVIPGRNANPAKVSVLARLSDPISFSDTSPDAQFGFEASGFDVAFSMQAGTAFPSQFATQPGPGADPSGTGMSFHARVAPGVVNDPQTFWSDGLSGAVDLFSLTVQSDANFNVQANLVVGASSADFAIDSSGVAAATAALQNAFQGNGGQLANSLVDLFTVGFVPQGLQEYTVGYMTELNVAAWETPEPSTGALFGVGAFLLAVISGPRWRRSGRQA